MDDIEQNNSVANRSLFDGTPSLPDDSDDNTIQNASAANQGLIDTILSLLEDSDDDTLQNISTANQRLSLLGEESPVNISNNDSHTCKMTCLLDLLPVLGTPP